MVSFAISELGELRKEPFSIFFIKCHRDFHDAGDFVRMYLPDFADNLIILFFSAFRQYSNLFRILNLSLPPKRRADWERVRASRQALFEEMPAYGFCFP